MIVFPGAAKTVPTKIHAITESFQIPEAEHGCDELNDDEKITKTSEQNSNVEDSVNIDKPSRFR